MEVHHHPHLPHGKKKFRDYFLEFLMIFLAVTLGFLAENLREHITEGAKEKEYIHSLVEDLETDRAFLQRVVPEMQQTLHGLDTLIDQTYLAVEGKGDTRLMYYAYHHYCRNIFHMELSQRTLNQLKNSGNMRLIRNDNAAKIISQMETGFERFAANTAFLKARQEDPAQFGLKIFDFREYQRANTNEDGSINTNDAGFLRLSYAPKLSYSDPAYLKEFAAHLGYYRNYFSIYVSEVEKAIKEVDVSIRELKEGYDMK